MIQIQGVGGGGGGYSIMQVKIILVQITEIFRYVKCIEKYITGVLLRYQMFMNNIIILLFG